MARALVIGSSGGIGNAVAAKLANRGFAVSRLSRREDGLDITVPSIVRETFGRLEGPFDIVFLATGILAPEGGAPEKSLAAIDGEVMATVLAINTVGVALVLKELPRLLPLNRRSVTAVLTARVGSIGDNQMGGWYSYRASKAAANQIVRSTAIEIGRRRKEAIVVALHPGTVNTPFTADFAVQGKHEPDQAADNLLAVIDRLTVAQSGGFFDYAGMAIEW